MNPLKLNLSSLLGGIAFVFLASVSSLANADGLLARGSDLGAADRAKLASLVARQRRTDPASFAAVRDLQGIRPEVYRERRNPIPEVGRELQHMGGKALLPVLEALVLDAPRVDGSPRRSGRRWSRACSRPSPGSAMRAPRRPCGRPS